MIFPYSGSGCLSEYLLLGHMKRTAFDLNSYNMKLYPGENELCLDFEVHPQNGWAFQGKTRVGTAHDSAEL